MRNGLAIGHTSSPIAARSSAAAAAAGDGRSNTENVESPSPRVLRTCPPWRRTISSTRASCRASVSAMAAGSASHFAVEPSMSVRRKVTARVPPSAGAPDSGGTSSEGWWSMIAASSRTSSAPGSTPSSSASTVRARWNARQRVALASGAVEGEHELGPATLAQRRVGDGGLEITDGLGRPPGGEQRVDAVLDERRVHLGPAGDLRPPAIRVRELRCPPPEAEGVVEVRQRARGVTGAQGVATGAGRLGVAGAVGQHALERPATAPGHHDRIPEPPTDRRDVGLERLGRGAGRRVTARAARPGRRPRRRLPHGGPAG